MLCYDMMLYVVTVLITIYDMIIVIALIALARDRRGRPEALQGLGDSKNVVWRALLDIPRFEESINN